MYLKRKKDYKKLSLKKKAKYLPVKKYKSELEASHFSRYLSS